MNKADLIGITKGLEKDDTYFYFYLKNYSRALNQELVRHHYLMNYTIKSTRYTLTQLKKEKKFTKNDFKRASKYIVLTNDKDIDKNSIKELEMLRQILEKNKSNDISKYNLIECYKTEAFVTFNFVTLINFLELRLAPDALWEIRELAKNIVNVLKQQEPEYFELLMENEKIKNDYEAKVGETK